ncbi:membrane protein [Mycolicibacterium aromaticivorans JS19b1 = JCM 16368]|uniref:Membrane protein n=1 Tax=Mycolicibacterium aromaticivorans JS19b1 = JCM 16368 TaxID=1440774 RepID=A0A064CPS8_9MYCO|nr:alpha/beta hydrolase-fold protein [Mycolicibacterium aromaticivorans]KDF02336.1 membrane protein [Mycolicibacterium aromaticivorans JS19b1 = JCM 16368]
MHEPIPVVLQAAAGAALIVAIGARSRKWWLLWGPAAVLCGSLLALWAYALISTEGVAGEPAPVAFWGWLAITGAAALVLLAGWQGIRWWRRVVSVLAVPLAALCAGQSLNAWLGYVPTVGAAWTQLFAAALPGQTDAATVTAMQRAGKLPPKGVVVSVMIDTGAVKFKHRNELVYLPPAWFISNPPPRLPAVMMIGGEFNTPTDWILAGDAVATLDDYAAQHGGNAPVAVFVDSGGAFNIDTECVDGPRGDAATHLAQEVPPFMASHFGVSPDPADWAIVGFSAGGTCAIDLTVMHPERFRTFVDIAGDMGPNSGNKAQTVSRLFGGSVSAWDAFDPATVMANHGRYEGVAALFTVSGARVDAGGGVTGANENERSVANRLCDLGRTQNIRCAVEAYPGKHDWPFAGRSFAAALQWLAACIHIRGSRPAESAQRSCSVR